VAGRVARLLITDNQDVKKGDLLVEIDPRDYETKRAQARANLAAARSRLEQSKAQFAVDQAKAGEEHANVVATEAESTRAQADLKRYQTVESRAVSKSQIDLAVSQAQSSTAQSTSPASKVQAAEAQADLSKVQYRHRHRRCRAKRGPFAPGGTRPFIYQTHRPGDGRVTRRTVEAGNYIQISQSLLAIVPHNVWITANFQGNPTGPHEARSTGVDQGGRIPATEIQKGMWTASRQARERNSACCHRKTQRAIT